MVKVQNNRIGEKDNNNAAINHKTTKRLVRSTTHPNEQDHRYEYHCMRMSLLPVPER